MLGFTKKLSGSTSFLITNLNKVIIVDSKSLHKNILAKSLCTNGIKGGPPLISKRTQKNNNWKWKFSLIIVFLLLHLHLNCYHHGRKMYSISSFLGCFACILRQHTCCWSLVTGQNQVHGEGETSSPTI